MPVLERTVDRARSVALRVQQEPARLVMAVSFGLALTYVFVIMPGLPADEPSHWSTVLFYSAHLRLPQLGQRAVSYDAQQGPVAYALDAVVYRLFHVVGGVSTGFFAVRALGAIEFTASVACVSWLIERVVRPGFAAVSALAVFALNPMMLGMYASVQNDGICILISFLALIVVLRHDRGVTTWRAIGVGLLVGTAFLAKETVWPLLLALPLLWLWRDGKRTMVPVLAFLGSFAVTTGWWIARNELLYGSLFGKADTGGDGTTFPPYRIHGLGGIFHIVENDITYIWVPTEYYRNVIVAPPVIKILLAVTTVAVIALCLWRLWCLRGLWSTLFSRFRAGDGQLSAWFLLATSAALSVGVQTVLFITVSAIAPRLGYLAWPCWLAMVAVAFDTVVSRRGRKVVAPALLGMLGLNAWVLWSAGSLGAEPFRIVLG